MLGRNWATVDMDRTLRRRLLANEIEWIYNMVKFVNKPCEVN